MVVTRFAPSPTGYLHVGGARTALFNWLLARHTNGKFILRIEDTDQKRNTPTAAKQVMDDLRWLGIQWDEGPEVGGPNGSYFQSQRLEIYQKYLDKLIESGAAYYCFDTMEELGAMREQAESAKKSLVYRKPAQLPDAKDVAKAKAEGKPVTIRLAIPQDKPIVINDIIRGEVTFNPDQISDFIILKSDGFPTYNFACVIDDELMNVTHVIRGQEHLMNTPCQQALQDALGFRRPEYAHMSVTVSDDGGKLSKRDRAKALLKAIKSNPNADKAKLAAAGKLSMEELESFIAGDTTPDAPVLAEMAKVLGIHLPEINVVDFFENGYIPEGMVNFLSLLGWNPGNQKEIMTVDELISCFDVTKFSKTNSLFDRQKLISFNTEQMRIVDKAKLFGHLKKYMKFVNSPMQKADDELLTRIIKACDGARTLEDIDKKSRFIFVDNDKIEYDEKSVAKVLLKGDGLAMLKIVRDKLAELKDFTEHGIEQMLRSLAEEKQVGLGKVAQPLRVALCGTTVSLPIFDSVQILGIDNTLKRIDITLEKFSVNAERS